MRIAMTLEGEMDWRVLSAVAACLSLAHAAQVAEPLFDASRPCHGRPDSLAEVPLDRLFVPLEPEARPPGSHLAIGKFASLGKDCAGNVEMLEPMRGRRHCK